MATARKTPAAKKAPTKRAGAEDKPSKLSNSEILEATLRSMDRLGGPSNSVFLAPSKKGTLIVSQSQSAVVEAGLPFVIEGLTEQISLDRGLLSSSIKGRKMDSIVFKNDGLRFKSNSYAVTVMVAQAAVAARAQKIEEPKFTFDMDSPLWEILSASVSATHMEKMHSKMPDVTTIVKFSKTGVMVVAFDAFQMSYSIVKKTGLSPMTFSIPQPRAESLFKDFPGNVTVSGDDTMVCVSSSGLRMSAPLPMADETAVPIEKVLEKVKAIEAQEGGLPRAVTIQIADIKMFLENARGLEKPNTEVSFKVTKESTEVTVEADGNKMNGKMVSKAKGSKEFEFKLDMISLKTLVSKSKDEVTLMVDDDNLMVRVGSNTYITILRVEEEPEEKPKAKKSKKREPEDEEE